MDHPLRVRRLERVGDAHGDLHGCLYRQTTAPEPLGQVFARNQLHREKRDAVDRMHPVDRGHVGVVERGQQLRFALEACEPLLVACDIRGQHLDRDLTIERRIDGLPDHAHATLADLLDQAVVEQLLSGRDRHVSFRNRV